MLSDWQDRILSDGPSLSVIFCALETNLAITAQVPVDWPFQSVSVSLRDLLLHNEPITDLVLGSSLTNQDQGFIAERKNKTMKDVADEFS